jgi:hypothetical protein
MASTAISAQQSILSIGATPTPIENITSFSGFDGEAAEIDVTVLDSVSKEFLAGLTDPGTFSFEFFPNFLTATAGQELLRAAALSGAVTDFELELSDGVKIDFQATVRNALSSSGGVDAALTGSASLRITGPITINQPA